MRKSMTVGTALLALLVMGHAVPAQEAVIRAAPEGLQAVGTAQSFEILTRAGAGKAEYFCSAGRFATLKLGARKTDRLVVTAVRVPSRYRENRLAVVFAVNGPEASEKPLEDTLRVGGPRVGQSASVGHSEALCSVEKGSSGQLN
ncbi:hypothetical protein R3X27_20225 [Tropicimonas sp. TH_r6]|uniref:hypothetical protein n=1 Tax=Tropicimonas sp. TH_r6 TaxID=3082085 RepID=UPI0029559A03|nr:hypothetical protein [Tropicimonas sp. TH_r6]MDV7145013.1 hypothetical protein [Tropicimonas sp. TH_r6]